MVLAIKLSSSSGFADTLFVNDCIESYVMNQLVCIVSRFIGESINISKINRPLVTSSQMASCTSQFVPAACFPVRHQVPLYTSTLIRVDYVHVRKT